MSVQSHLEELKRRHAAIQQEIKQELAHPGTDQIRLAELKRKKLVLKDEIMRLGSPDTVH